MKKRERDRYFYLPQKEARCQIPNWTLEQLQLWQNLNFKFTYTRIGKKAGDKGEHIITPPLDMLCACSSFCLPLNPTMPIFSVSPFNSRTLTLDVCDKWCDWLIDWLTDCLFKDALSIVLVV